MNYRFYRLCQRPWPYPATTLVLLLGLLGVGGYLGAWNIWAQYHYRAAERALQRRDFSRAWACLELSLEVWSRSAHTHFLAARTARRAGFYADAERHLSRCAELHGEPEAIELERALLCAQRGELADVESYLVSCVQQEHPDTPLILEALIQGYRKTYRLLAALGCLKRLFQWQPEHVQGLLWRAEVWECLLYRGKALQDYRRIVELDPEQDAARLRLAESLLESRQVQEAQGHFERLRPRQPSNVKVLCGLARCWRALSRMEEAQHLLDLVLAVDPRSARALTERGQLALAMGQDTAAESWLRKAVAEAPHERDANYALSQCLKLRGQHEEAQHYLHQVQGIETDLERLEAVTRKMITAPRDPALRYEAGVLLLRNGQEQEGLGWLQSVLLEDPHHQATRQALAQYTARAGEPAFASGQRQPALPTKPTR